MILRDIFPYLKLSKKIETLKIKGISDDSRQLNKGDIFFIIRRKNFDIFSVLNTVQSKAAILIADVSYGSKLKKVDIIKPIIFVKDIKKGDC